MGEGSKVEAFAPGMSIQVSVSVDSCQAYSIDPPVPPPGNTLLNMFPGSKGPQKVSFPEITPADVKFSILVFVIVLEYTHARQGDSLPPRR